MQYRKLGRSNIDVSVICLGTMTYGEQNSKAEGHLQLDYAFDQGINFIDTAEMYPIPPKKSTYSNTEQIIGKWDKLQTERDKIILATKVIGKSQSFDYVRNGNTCLDKKNIKEAINSSLKRLKVEYIDLYQLHWPDRPTNYFGQRGYIANNSNFYSFEEILHVLQEIKQEGKVREFGLSNETPWGAMSYLNLSSNNLPRMQSIQNPYSLLNRTFEVGLAEISHREKCGLLAYSPLGFGVLSGKYLDNQFPEGSRLKLYKDYLRYSSTNSTNAVIAYCELAKKYNLDPAVMALAFTHSRSFLTSTIIGATTMNQLKTNIESINVDLSKELLEEINTIHEKNPNPSP
ncbi:MAG: NADP(H)-dependent aldo-keto reductase [Bacteriovoracaceae bacterium]|jgi:aryl-alcohol dehydrogenase-like predicted oxidoreductase|nr:NADP(H)-dependent aldo-keto reductase [Bacteriovoracaceae bacterium]